MNKKFLSAVLFGALAAASTGSFVSCKDYDDDIENLQTQINGLSKDLKDGISQVQSSVESVKTSCQTNVNDAIAKLKDGDVKKALADAAAAAQAAATASDAAAVAQKTADEAQKAIQEAEEAAKKAAEAIAENAAAAEKAQKAADEAAKAVKDLEAKSATKEAVEAAQKAAEAAQKAADDAAAAVEAAKVDCAAANDKVTALADAAQAAADKGVSDAAKAQKAAEAAQKAADAAKDLAEAAQKAIEDVTGLSTDDIEQLKWVKDNAKKLATAASVDEKIAKVKEELLTIGTADSQKIANDIDALKAQVIALAGHRLTSLSVIPTNHINGIASLDMVTLVYTPQVYNKDAHEGYNTGYNDPSHLWTPDKVLDHVAVTEKVNNVDVPVKPNLITNGESKAYYHISPNMGVRPEDIDAVNFVTINSQNSTRAAGTTIDTKIKPVSYDIDNKTGVMTVKYTKAAVNDTIPVAFRLNDKGQYTYYDGTLYEPTAHYGTEEFHMVSLRASVSEENWTEDEKAAGDPVYVYSEYQRISEQYKRPYLVNSKAGDVKYDQFPDELDKNYPENRVYVHYHDSLCLYKSGVNEMVDHKIVYNKTVDLLDYVEVCLTDLNTSYHGQHTKLTREEYLKYGLDFRFAVAEADYMQGNLETNEQEFAMIDGTMLSSKVYTVGDEEKSKTAIGREPIIRIELIDTKNDNALVALRYMKIKWTKMEIPAQEIPAVDLGEQLVTCKDMFKQLGTEDMNVKVYHQVKLADGSQSIDKVNFHSEYTNVKVLYVKKDGELIYEDGKSELKDADGDIMRASASSNLYGSMWYPGSKLAEVDGDEFIMNGRQIVFGFLRDNSNDNTSYNIVWAMSPAAVGTIKKGGSDFEIKVKYSDYNGDISAITQVFTQKIVVPTQNFAYQGTYWKDGNAAQGTGVFQVNPIVFNTKNDKGNLVLDNPHSPDCALMDYSHIEADLVNGWTYTKGNTKPANLSEFIQHIRGCASVKYIFDSTRFANYENLKGYQVDPTGTQLWYDVKMIGDELDEPQTLYTDIVTTALNGRTDFTDEGILDYVADEPYNEIYDEVDGKTVLVKSLAASINNHLYSKPATTKNDKLLEWNFEESLNGSGNVAFSQVGHPVSGEDEDACYSLIRLHEIDQKNGTYAAKQQIGQKVPVSLVVEYNAYNKDSVQNFEVFFIDPLKVNGAIPGKFIDCVIDGSYLEVSKNFSFTDWNGYLVQSSAKANATEKEKYAHELYDYYAVKSVVFDTDETTTCLELNGDTWIATEGKTDGPMPAGSMLKMMSYNATTKEYSEVPENPTHLAYFNEHGTPVDYQYHLFVNVSVDYKWGKLSKNGLAVPVEKAGGVSSEEQKHEHK